MSYSIEISTDNVVIISNDGESLLLQPTWPDGTAWASKAEAQAWADQAVLALTDPTADFAGPNPANPTVPRPIEEPEEVELSEPTPGELEA